MQYRIKGLLYPIKDIAIPVTLFAECDNIYQAIARARANGMHVLCVEEITDPISPDQWEDLITAGVVL